MMLFRPVREDDLDDIIRLASRAGVGMTSLPNDPARLAARIQRSVETFAGKLPRGQQGFGYTEPYSRSCTGHDCDLHDIAPLSVYCLLRSSSSALIYIMAKLYR